MFQEKLKARGITPQSDFLTWCHVKEEFPAALHAKLAVGADRTRARVYCMDGSGNFSRYGSGSDHFYLTASGRTRTHPNMSTESMLLSPVPLDSDCWRSWAFEITRKDMGLLRKGRIVDIQTSTLTNYKSTMESEKRDQAHFEASFIDTRSLQEREEEKLARKVNSVVNHQATAMLEKLIQLSIDPTNDKNLSLSNPFATPVKYLPEPPDFPPAFLSIQEDFKTGNDLPSGWKVGVYTYCCGG